MRDLETAELSIRQGSKSFNLAGMFFPFEQWSAACHIYHWCRYCDDTIDLHGKPEDLQDLLAETHAVLETHKHSGLPAFRSLDLVIKKYRIPSLYPLELLRGMEMDIQGQRYQTLEELELYCYRVASSVGLMMCYIMGIYKIGALKNAAHLGLAMQLTNIARDVSEDHANSRVYLPLDWLSEEGIDQRDLFRDPEKTFRVVLRILEKADSYYESGLKGVKHLPLRSAFVITLSAFFYRAIGQKIRTLGPKSFKQRAVVGHLTKLSLIIKALGFNLLTLPERIRFRKRQPVTIDRTWGLT